MTRILKLWITSLLMFITSAGFAQDPNFFIFLSFGQSNMEGQGTIESQDLNVDNRFKVFQSVDCSNLSRQKSTWYDAIPPLCRCWSGISPTDYFGRILIETLPKHIKVGVINVSVGGCRIELFDKDIYQNYTNTYPDVWFQDIIKEYEGNPYEYLLSLAKSAQKDGVIKGILLHQGESNNGDSEWPKKVKKIYTDMIDDLNLDATKTPLLVGELVHEDQNGQTAGMNKIINKLTEILDNSYVISSSGCTPKSDNIHFNSAGYRELGKRYGEKMLSLLEYDANVTLNSEKQLMDLEMYAIYPNPVNGLATISFNIPNDSHIILKVFDQSGKEVALITSKKYLAGKHQIETDLSHLISGIYLIKLETDGDNLFQKLIIN